MGTFTFLVRRTLELVPTLLGLLLLIFLIARVMPGDPVRLALGPEATLEQAEAFRAELGLDQPLWKQFVDYVVGLTRGEFGTSLRTYQDVSEDVADSLAATLELVIVALFLAIAVGVPIGMASAMYRDTWIDDVVRAVSISGVALPRFWVGIMLQIWLGSMLGWFPIIGRDAGVPPDHVTGMYVLDSLLTWDLSALRSSLLHITLPAITLALPSAAQLARLTRASMIEVFRQQYVLVHRAYGVHPQRIAWTFALRNGLTSVLTLVGLSFGALIENAVLVEVVFSWPGISAYGASAVIAKDFNAVVAVTLIIGLAFLVANLIVDVVYGLMDPRVRHA